MNRNELTEAILNGMGKPHFPEDVLLARKTWWANPANNSKSLQLTKTGFDVFNKAEIQFYRVDFNEDLRVISGQFYLDLIKSMNCPFFINFKKRCIHVTSDKIAVQLCLYGGNLTQFIKIKAQTRKKEVDKTE